MSARRSAPVTLDELSRTQLVYDVWSFAPALAHDGGSAARVATFRFEAHAVLFCEVLVAQGRRCWIEERGMQRKRIKEFEPEEYIPVIRHPFNSTIPSDGPHKGPNGIDYLTEVKP